MKTRRIAGSFFIAEKHGGAYLKRSIGVGIALLLTVMVAFVLLFPKEVIGDEANKTENAVVVDNAVEEPIVMYYTENDVTMIAKVLYRECRGVPSITEQACVAWTILNRVDDGRFGNSISEVITRPNQFAYKSNTPVTNELHALALDVLTRWNAEKNGMENMGRVLPKEYLYFNGSGGHNHFRTGGSNSTTWKYELMSPYAN